MKVLVVGSGGREHALVWKLAQSANVTELYCAPGNGGIASLATCIPIAATDIDAMVDYAVKEAFDLVVVAPDDPLAMGMVDRLEEKGIKAFGPCQEAAVIESSKTFSKNLMKKYDIPTASYAVFDDKNAALSHLKDCPYPTVVKADGLALGKGVYICSDLIAAQAAVSEIMEERKFGDAGNQILIEEYMSGPEISVLTFCDGQCVKAMVSAQDHKRAYDDDKGPNTGGMGVFAPSPLYAETLRVQVEEEIIRPTVAAMSAEGRPFKGVLYFGLMLTENGPKVLEYNARFGDPETQVVLPLLENDLLDIFLAVVDGTLSEIELKFKDACAVCVVMASGGYPGNYEKGMVITGLESLENQQDVIVFHAGTQKTSEGEILSNGGRVLGVTAIDESMCSAIDKAYAVVSQIQFDGAHYRTDIGQKAL